MKEEKILKNRKEKKKRLKEASHWKQEKSSKINGSGQSRF
jgi:hypothetical protein